MSQCQKVGLKTGKGGVLQNRPIIARSNGDFVSVVDGVTFGIADGRLFHSGRHDWSVDDQIRWATSNAVFFARLTDNLNNYAAGLESEKEKLARHA